jgi:mono/diheme cytochrome c family protein
VVGLILSFMYVRTTGLTALAQPGVVETRVARAVRRLAVSEAIRNRRNPVPATLEATEDGLAHFADHCASCHGNDGSGDTEMGRGLFPKAPDMRQAATQGLTDGELFYIIENGVRFTGMPGWSTGTPEGEDSTWRLVHFIRHLPDISSDEIRRIEALTPRSPEAVRQEIEEEQFLSGGGDSPPPAPSTSTTHEHGAHQ